MNYKEGELYYHNDYQREILQLKKVSVPSCLDFTVIEVLKPGKKHIGSVLRVGDQVTYSPRADLIKVSNRVKEENPEYKELFI